MLQRLGDSKKAMDLRFEEDTRWGVLREGTAVFKGEPLFPRVELKKSKAAPRAVEPPRKSGAAAGPDRPPFHEPIPLELFQQVDLRVGVVRKAEVVPKSRKLLRLVVDIGEERQVVAGVAQDYAPEELVGRQVVVVANLQPARLMGVESHGMVLAVRDGEKLSLLTTDGPVSPGRRVS